jgi:hypothetical protein
MHSSAPVHRSCVAVPQLVDADAVPDFARTHRQAGDLLRDVQAAPSDAAILLLLGYQRTLNV